jgi:ketosteroid isomerase-like protein
MRTSLAFAILMFASAGAVADDKADAIAPVHQFISDLNRNDIKGAAAAYAPTASIIDEFPPHHWQGPTAFADWGRDFGVDAQKHGDTDPFVTLGVPTHVSIEGDRAYAVFPSTYSFKEHGKQIDETGSTMTFALQKFANGWRIVGWSWATH